ncbi:MAG: threonine/serine exporter family protein [Clostridia bacterium]|nr:threonine/serine exporter family protein [Clostridia bacterium]MCI2000819.1 threonine/serine exporter family protein [Clostridia bacterium]MCI2015389.1 threonine/serine exporter family protein [Clostridia bacterium]
MMGKTIATIIGVWAFAVLFYVPKKQYIHCIVTGTVGYIIYLIAMNLGASAVAATLFASLAMTVAARLFSVIRMVPATIFIVTGIFPLVPGSNLYYTAYYTLNGNVLQGVIMGVLTFKIAFAIALGIVIGSAFPQKWFNDIGKRLRIKENRS